MCDTRVRVAAGYGVLLRVQQMTHGALLVEQGALYPALYRLERQGLLETEWGTSENNRKAKFYRLTAAGRKRLREQTDGWNRMVGIMGAALKTRAGEVLRQARVEFGAWRPTRPDLALRGVVARRARRGVPRSDGVVVHLGVQSHGVAERTREFGVRLSLGATAAQIRALVLKDGYRPVLQGLAIGIVLGFIGRGLVRAFWWDGMSLADAWMLVAVPVPLLLAALVACWLPAARASRVDPNVALRHL